MPRGTSDRKAYINGPRPSTGKKVPDREDLTAKCKAAVARLPERGTLSRTKLIHGAFSIHRAEVEVFNDSDDVPDRKIRRRARDRIRELAERLDRVYVSEAEELTQFEVKTWETTASRPYALPKHKWVTDDAYDLRAVAAKFLDLTNERHPQP